MDNRGSTKTSINAFLVFIMLGLGLLNYQSCAPASENFEQDSVNTLPVDSIDAINVGQISFPQAKVSAFLNQEVNIAGLCDQAGSLIGWRLKTPEGEIIERGLAQCDLGSFEVRLSDSWEYLCDLPLKLEASLGTKALSETIIEGHCQ